MKIILFVVLAALLIFQNPLQEKISVFQYLDEAYALLMVPAAVIHLYKQGFHVSKRTKIFIGLIIGFFCIGWAGHFVNQYQPMTNALKDAYVNLKFFMSIGATVILFEDLDTKAMVRWLWWLLCIISSILFVLCVLDLFVGIYERQYRYGLPAIKLFYSAYTYIVAQCTLLMAIGIWLYEYKGNKVLIPLAMIVFVLLCTLRTKALGSIACVVLIYILLFGKSRKLAVCAWGVIGLAVVAAICQVLHYYVNLGTESARAVLTIGSAYVAFDHFPFGTGWGTYGSAFSVEPYSPVYTMYNMQRVWGISPDYSEFVSDTFWPMILGQCGIIGLGLYIAILVLLFKWILELKNKSPYMLASALTVFGYLLICSTGESAFVNPTAVPLAMWLGFLMRSIYTKQEKTV